MPCTSIAAAEEQEFEKREQNQAHHGGERAEGEQAVYRDVECRTRDCVCKLQQGQFQFCQRKNYFPRALYSPGARPRKEVGFLF